MRFFFIICLSAFLFSCGGNKTPDVSAIKVNLQTQRFEKDFFAIDTNNVTASLDKLQEKYPTFNKTFLLQILGIDPRWSNDTLATYVKDYLSYSTSVYNESEKLFGNFNSYDSKLKKAFQFVKYYFPKYKIPSNIITFLGPANGASNALGDDFLCIGLQAHLGKDFPLYKTESVRETYPDYVSANFTPDFIEINSMRSVINDMFPENEEDKRLVIQMIEKGKRLYLLQMFLPSVAEHKLINYTDTQMKDCYAGETKIWGLFLQNNYLQVADNNLIKNFVSEGPKTQELGENAPGNIGSFAGWQIVKKYSLKNPQVTPDSLMRTNSETIFKEAKYKP